MFCVKVLTAVLLVFNIYSVKSGPLESDSSSICQRCHPLVDGKVNVHLVPHSHDDVGWLKTFSQYYEGTGNFDNYADAGVQYILDSTVKALKANLKRRYIQVETAYFWKWWEHQDEETRRDVRNLVNRGQMEMVNGAWSMNDEANTNYQSIIDQFTWGFYTLNRTLGLCGRPRIGWQIDPFGHSREHASLMKQLGFDGLVVGRLDYVDKQNRQKNKNLDFMWKTSSNLENSEIFTSMFPNFYVYEEGFRFDVMDDDRMSADEETRKEQIKRFEEILNMYKEYYRTPNILIPMGGDFTYQKAEINFENAEKLMEGFKDHPTYNLFYSTPSCYVQAVKDAVNQNTFVQLTEKTDDFFPYASDKHSYWAGYFTSRPSLKRFERMGNNILQSAKQLVAFSRIEGKDYGSSVTELREAMGVLQHHDAITGTEKQAVANDYARMLHQAIKTAEKPLGPIVGKLLGRNGEVDLKLSICLMANVSICEESRKDKFLVAVYNPLSRDVKPYIRIPVDGNNYKVFGNIIGPYNIFDTIHSFDYVQEDIAPSNKVLSFSSTSIPPMGIHLYYIEKIPGISNYYYPFQDLIGKTDNYFGGARNGFRVDLTTGKLTSINMNGENLEVEQEFLYYNGASYSSVRASGAYIFRPINSTTKPMSTNIRAKFAMGTHVDELLQYLSPEVTQIIRVYKSDEDQYIEFDWLVGDLQYDTNYGKEVITKFKIKNFTNGGVFYTDSNGREQIKRVKDQRNDYDYNPTIEPVASNYYPITSKIVIKDEKKRLEVAVLTDRAQGGASLEDGTIEIMIHRRLVRDDGFGVDETLNERQYDRGLFARGQHYFTFGSMDTNAQTGKSTAAYERDLTYKKLLEPLVLVGDATIEELNSLEKVQDLLHYSFEGLKSPLNENVKILTFEPWVGSYLLRLEHVLEKREDGKLSSLTTVNLRDAFSSFNITEIAETTLGANPFGYDKLAWKKVNNFGKDEDPLMITLNPMQIRTFFIKTNKNNGDISNNGSQRANNIFMSTVVMIIVFILL